MTPHREPAELLGAEQALVSHPVSVTDFDPATDQLPDSRVRYRARGGVVFVFTPVRLPDGRFRAYIREQPLDYRGRDCRSYATHRLADRHCEFVCWKPEAGSAPELLAVMRIWAEGTVHYIATGRFSDRPNRALA